MNTENVKRLEKLIRELSDFQLLLEDNPDRDHLIASLIQAELHASIVLYHVKTGKPVQKAN